MSKAQEGEKLTINDWLAGFCNHWYQYCTPEMAIRCNWHVLILKIVQQIGFSRRTVHRVVHQHLMLRKVSTCWVPKQLKPEQQAIHNDVPRQLSVSYDTDGEVMLERVVTGDGTWIHHYQTRDKASFHAVEAQGFSQSCARCQRGKLCWRFVGTWSVFCLLNFTNLAKL